MTEDHTTDDMTDGSAPAGQRHEPRLIPLWVAGVGALAAVVVLQSVLGDLGPAQAPLATPTE